MTNPITFLIAAFVLMLLFLVIVEAGLLLRNRREQLRWRDEWRRRRKS
jgi:NADH:ubiquinone oxidoreductase subunit 3 (subunit A)